MSRWAEAFAALEEGADTVDTKRHSAAAPPTMSQSVDSVRAASEPLSEPPSAPHLPPTAWGEPEAERAAIVEHDGGIRREWAEGFAQLDPDRPPGDVPLTRWRRFIDDIGWFLDSPFCAVAAALCWGPHDLFGCDRDRPFARIDCSGLLWLVNGNRVVALSENAAVIEDRTGVRQTWRRRPSEPGRVLVWELTSR